MPPSDPTGAAILDRNPALLAKVRLDTGPQRVVRVPMPSHEDGVWRTHTNGIFVNRLYLMPTYAGSDPSGQAAALKTFQRLLPGWDVVGLGVGPLIKEGGALRCIRWPRRHACTTIEGKARENPDRRWEQAIYS